MITVSAQPSKTPSGPLALLDPKSPKELSESFSNLLHSLSGTKSGLSLKEELALMLHNGDDKELPLQLKDAKEIKDPKKEELLSLLKNGKEESDAKNIIINPQLASLLDQKTLKSVIKEAKEYLKDQIKETLEYKKGEIKELPKTTKGLVNMAQKLGIDVEKITLETVREKADPKNINSKETKEFRTDDGALAKVVSTKNVQETDSKDGKTKTITKQETKSVQIVKDGTPLEKTEVIKTVQTTQTQSQEQSSNGNKNNDALLALLKTPVPEGAEKIPLFKTSTELLNAHTTAELVDNKMLLKNQQKPSKSDDILKALLHGDKNSERLALGKTDSLFAHTQTLESKHKEHSSVLSRLLHGDEQQQNFMEGELFGAKENHHSSLHVKSSDDLSIKIHEAKQMVKYLAQDIKQAIENYKPPFTRIKVKLNPQKLGEVDLTVVQRGKNLHVNISSNQTAITTLAQNANDLKTQLNQNGMNNATLQFSSSSDNQNQQQQNNQQRKNAQKAYDYFDGDESNEEVLSSLEIVVPRYI